MMGTQVVVLTANPAIDITYRLAENRPDDTNRVRQVTRRAGGKGLNVARVLTTLGVTVESILPLGGDAGEWMRGALAADGSAGAVHAVPIAGQTRSTVAIVADAGHPTIYVEPGPTLGAAEWRSVTDAVAERTASARFLVVSGSLPAGADPALLDDWVAAGHRAGARVVVDCSGPALLAAASAGADIVKPNGDELRQATGADDLSAGMRRLRDLGAGSVVVSRGADGMVALGEDAVHAESGMNAVEHFVPAVPNVTGNPTGAGDAATAGLVAALLAEHPLSVALRWAAAAGAAAVRQPIAGTIDPADFEAYVASYT